MGPTAGTRSELDRKGWVLLSPGVPDRFIGVKIVSKSLRQRRLGWQMKDREAVKCSCACEGLLFCADGDIVNRRVWFRRKNGAFPTT